MPKMPQGWDPAGYTPVAERMQAFRAAYPAAQVVTRLHAWENGRITFRAAIYRSADEQRPAATGWASEKEGDGEINTSACLENAETSAVGRALANFGFTGVRPREGNASRHDRRIAEPRIATTSDKRGPDPVLQEAASAVGDVLQTLRAAERAGMPAADVRRLDDLLGGRSVPPSTLLRAERELRAWFDGRRSH